MNTTEIEELEALLSATDFTGLSSDGTPMVIPEMLAHPFYGKELKFFCLLEYPSEDLMSRYSELQLYYYRYYYCLKFAEKYKIVNGPASDMDQRVFKVWEQGDNITDYNVDWEYVHDLQNEVLAELGLPEQPK